MGMGRCPPQVLMVPLSVCLVSAEPWDYPLFILVGAYVGYKYPGYEAKLLQEVNERRAAIDQPPVQLHSTLDLKKWE